MMAIGKTDVVVTKYLAAMDAKDGQYVAHDRSCAKPERRFTLPSK